MDELAPVERQQGGSPQAFRVVVSLAALIGFAYLLVVSVILASIKCGDGCEGAAVGPEHWQWTAQLVLAVVGVACGAAALALGFTSRAVAYRRLLAFSLLCVLAWLLWVLGFGAF